MWKGKKLGWRNWIGSGAILLSQVTFNTSQLWYMIYDIGHGYDFIVYALIWWSNFGLTITSCHRLFPPHQGQRHSAPRHSLIWQCVHIDLIWGFITFSLWKHSQTWMFSAVTLCWVSSNGSLNIPQHYPKTLLPTASSTRCLQKCKTKFDIFAYCLRVNILMIFSFTQVC